MDSGYCLKTGKCVVWQQQSLRRADFIGIICLLIVKWLHGYMVDVEMNNRKKLL